MFLLDDEVLSIISDQTGMQYPQTSPHNDQTEFQLHVNLPTTPQMEKIEKVIKQWLYKYVTNAGRLASKLAMEIFFSEKILVDSLLTGDRGKLKILEQLTLGIYMRFNTLFPSRIIHS